MTTYKEVIHDAETGKVTERAYTDEENAKVNAAKTKAEADLKAAEAEAAVKATAKAALLTKLGLTADEFATLIS